VNLTRTMLIFIVYSVLAGWSSKFDETLPRTSDRLAPHLTYAKGGKETNGVQHSWADARMFDDSTDPQNTCAVFRVCRLECGAVILSSELRCE